MTVTIILTTFLGYRECQWLFSPLFHYCKLQSFKWIDFKTELRFFVFRSSFLGFHYRQQRQCHKPSQQNNNNNRLAFILLSFSPISHTHPVTKLSLSFLENESRMRVCLTTSKLPLHCQLPTLLTRLEMVASHWTPFTLCLLLLSWSLWKRNLESTLAICLLRPLL